MKRLALPVVALFFIATAFSLTASAANAEGFEDYIYARSATGFGKTPGEAQANARIVAAEYVKNVWHNAPYNINSMKTDEHNGPEGKYKCSLGLAIFYDGPAQD